MSRRTPGWPGAMWLAIGPAVLFWSPAVVASPSPSAGPAGGDPQTSGEGPGLAGDPVIAIVAVLGVGLASLVVTYLYVRLTAARTHP